MAVIDDIDVRLRQTWLVFTFACGAQATMNEDSEDVRSARVVSWKRLKRARDSKGDSEIDEPDPESVIQTLALSDSEEEVDPEYKISKLKVDDNHDWHAFFVMANGWYRLEGRPQEPTLKRTVAKCIRNFGMAVKTPKGTTEPASLFASADVSTVEPGCTAVPCIKRMGSVVAMGSYLALVMSWIKRRRHNFRHSQNRTC